MAQENAQKQTSKNTQTEVEEIPTESASQVDEKSVEDILAQIDEVTEEEIDFDALLDEIDEALEENAEQFVAQYIQKGGE